MDSIDDICILIQLPKDQDNGMFELQHNLQAKLNALLRKKKVGYCDGSEISSSSMEVFCYVAHHGCIELVKEEALKIAPDATIASLDHALPPSLQKWIVHHPADGDLLFVR